MNISRLTRASITYVRRSMVGISLTGAFVFFPTQLNLLPISAAVAASAVVDGEVRCEQCEYWWEGELGGGGVVYLKLKHQFVGECSNSLQAANPTPDAGGEEGESGSYCARCNGTSVCHYSPDDGMCHIQCGPGGGEEVQLREQEKAKALVRTADIRGLANLLQQSTTVVYNEKRHSLQIVGCNSETVVDNIELGAAIYVELEKAIAATAD